MDPSDFVLGQVDGRAFGVEHLAQGLMIGVRQFRGRRFLLLRRCRQIRFPLGVNLLEQSVVSLDHLLQGVGRGCGDGFRDDGIHRRPLGGKLCEPGFGIFGKILLSQCGQIEPRCENRIGGFAAGLEIGSPAAENGGNEFPFDGEGIEV